MLPASFRNFDGSTNLIESRSGLQGCVGIRYPAGQQGPVARPASRAIFNSDELYIIGIKSVALAAAKAKGNPEMSPSKRPVEPRGEEVKAEPGLKDSIVTLGRQDQQHDPTVPVSVEENDDKPGAHLDTYLSAVATENKPKLEVKVDDEEPNSSGYFGANVTPVAPPTRSRNEKAYHTVGHPQAAPAIFASVETEGKGSPEFSRRERLTFAGEPASARKAVLSRETEELLSVYRKRIQRVRDRLDSERKISEEKRDVKI